MPNMDGTGPRSNGPMTGRGVGGCRRYPSCCGNGNWQTLTKEERLELLKKDKGTVEKEISDLENSK